MTESEWLTCTDAEAIAAVAWQTVSDRKVRLIACGCCRLAWDWLVDGRSRKVVEVSERFADGLATERELRSAAWYAEAAVFALDERLERSRREQQAIRDGWLAAEDAIFGGFINGRNRLPIPLNTARSVANCAEATAHDPSSVFRELPNSIFSLAVLRDVVGNPFRPVVADASWLTSDVLALARGIYDDRAFDRMPILADALQDAGCDSADVLNHCRDANATHVRGCWVIDLILGRV